MTIFGESRLGRIGYAIVVLLMLGFDFAKQPIERYIVSLQDAVAEDLLASHPVTKEELAKSGGSTNGLSLAPFQKDLMAEYAKSGGKVDPKAFEAKAKMMAMKSLMNFGSNFDVTPERQAKIDKHQQLAGLYPVAVIAMTGITILALLWMISSRLRDIGWPQYGLWILLAPVFLPKFIHIPLPELALQGINVFFYGALIALAFVPGAGSGSDAPLIAQPLPVAARAPTGSGKSSGFGRLGR